MYFEWFIIRHLFSSLVKLAGKAIYFACVNFFLFLIWDRLSQDLPIFTTFSPNERFLREFSRSRPLFKIALETLPWQPILCRNQNTNHMRFLQFLYHMKDFGVDDRSTGPIFTILLPNGRYLHEFSWSVQFIRFFKGRCHGNQFCVVPDLLARSRSISGSGGLIFTIFTPYSRYWTADDQYVLLFPIS